MLYSQEYVDSLLAKLEAAEKEISDWRSVAGAAAQDDADWHKLADTDNEIICKLANALIGADERAKRAEKKLADLEFADYRIWHGAACHNGMKVISLENENAELKQRAEAAEARLLVPDGWNVLGPTYPAPYTPVLVAMNGVVQHITYQIEEGDNGDYWQPVNNEDDDGAPINQFQHWKPLPTAPVYPVEGGE
ncbi:hypothetical protein PL78_06390 [Yersinia entomophaga]|uniref:DUF551 domain-containing protein n=2 Tax=Yersinia entomophaga TaxID=935293 RepID=A0ABN4PVJ9_YERET|nr:DUF551 domain-containing protein [Yersinia entomophaga]ANI29467.1 hypothetical protein PL78_06390 [Yersinia entomophaga]